MVTVKKFGAAWCGPCRALAPVLEGIKNDFAGKATFIEYDVDNSDEKILEKNLRSLEMEIERKRSTLAWAWGTGNADTRRYVVGEVQRQTGWEIEESDLPDDLVDRPKETLLISTGSLEDSK